MRHLQTVLTGPVGLPANAGVVFYTWAMVLLFFLFQSTLALAVTALSSSVGVVSCLVPFFLVALEVRLRVFRLG